MVIIIGGLLRMQMPSLLFDRNLVEKDTRIVDGESLMNFRPSELFSDKFANSQLYSYLCKRIREMAQNPNKIRKRQRQKPQTTKGFLSTKTKNFVSFNNY